MRRLILVDPGIDVATGHDFHHARTIADECARRGIPLDVLAPRKIDDDAASALDCRSVFRVGAFDQPRFKRPLRSLHSLAAYASWSRKYRRDFEAALDGRAGADDLLLVNTITICGLAGLAGWLAAKPAGDRPATAAILRFGAEEGLPRAVLPGLSRRLYRRVLDRLHRLLGHRLQLAADTRLIGEDFERLIGRPVIQIPFPIRVPEAVPPRPGPRPAHLVFLTSSRPDKGFHLLPGALEAAFAASENLTATVRVVASPRKSHGHLVERLRALGPRVRILDGALDDAFYYELMSEADAVLLPYDPQIYAKRSSQMLAEAASLGRAVLVPAGSFLDRERLSTGIVGVPIEAFTPEALAEAIGRFVADKDRLIAAAWAACPGQRKRHGVTAFLDHFIGFAATANGPGVRSEGAGEIGGVELGIRLD